MRRWSQFRVARVAAVLGVALTVAVGPSQHATAAIYQCSSQGSRWTGWTSRDSSRTQPYTGIEGSSSYIIANYDTSVCATDEDPETNFSYSYNMVYDADDKDWSQAGTFFGYGDDCVYRAAEQALNDDSLRLYYGCSDPGERSSYRNLVEGSPYHMAAYINGIPEMVTSYNPIDVWEYPYDIQFMGETKYMESNVAGVPSSKQLFTGMGVQQYTTDDLVTSCGNVYLAHYHNIPPRYSTDDVSCSYVRTWTNDGR